MYLLDNINSQNSEPWNIPLPIRVKYLRQYLTDGYRVCIMIYHNADTSTFRYRVYNIHQILNESDSNWRVVYFYGYELDMVDDYLYKADVLSFVRQQWSHRYDRIIKKAKYLGVSVVFDTDDLVFDIDYITLLIDTLGVNENDDAYNYWFSYISRIGKIASMADSFTATNNFLGNMLNKLYNKPYFVIPNFLNFEQIAVSNEYSLKKKETEYCGPYTIGYFSGSPSHINDFNLISAEMCALLEDFPNMQLNIVGFMEFTSSSIVKLLNNGRITFTPLVDFLTLQRLIAESDVNIAPLVVNDFTNCKTELKFFEAAIVDTITVASPTYTFTNSIKDKETGFLCKQGEWYDTIKRLYTGKIDTAAICKRAKDYVIEKYSGEQVVKQISSAFSDILQKKKDFYDIKT